MQSITEGLSASQNLLPEYRNASISFQQFHDSHIMTEQPAANSSYCLAGVRPTLAASNMLLYLRKPLYQNLYYIHCHCSFEIPPKFILGGFFPRGKLSSILADNCCSPVPCEQKKSSAWLVAGNNNNNKIRSFTVRFSLH